jgi:hypothetical protein
MVRSTDRVEALILTLAVVVALLAVPIAAAVGTAVHDARRDHYAGQAASRSLVSATITEVPTFADGPPHGATTVQALWSVGETEHTGALAAPTTSKVGDTVQIWVDNNTGKWSAEPTSTARAALEAVTAALLIWTGVAGAVLVLYIGTRATCDRIRFTRWQLGFADLVEHGDGRTRHHQ